MNASFRSGVARALTLALLFSVRLEGAARATPPCAATATCIDVTGTGTPSPTGLFVASCAETFPDFIVRKDSLPMGYAGAVFKLSQDYPTKAPQAEAVPWAAISFKKNATDYLMALRDYVFEGMIAADFRPENNAVRKWFNVPYLTYGANAREAVHGLTSERIVNPPELGLTKPAHNFAIGFYNAPGGYALGRIWKDPRKPNPTAAKFAKGTMVFKILFTDADASNFPAGKDITAGAPAWTIGVKGVLQTVRLLQMDVAVRDSRSPTGWVYGTFAYDAAVTGTDAWHKMQPVGLMFGDDPTYTPADRAANKPLNETIITPAAPPYALAHLGAQGRLNGPVDNPVSSCISCHSTAEYPIENIANILPFGSCNTDAKRLIWFRDLTTTKPFGAVDKTTCTLSAGPTGLKPLGTSLQLLVALHQQLDNTGTNPCLPPASVIHNVIAPSPAAAPGGDEIVDRQPINR